MFAIDKEAILFASQMTRMDVRKAPEGFYENILCELVYGGKVLTANDLRLCTLKYV
jgi:hypothetical protein